jgi:GIY-YIG catalytic domain
MKYDIVQPLLKDYGLNIILKYLLLLILLFLIYQIYCYKLQYDNLFPIFYFQCLNIIPLKTYSDLSNFKLLKKDLSNKGGVYSLIHIKSSKQYIGSSSNLYIRIMNHIKGKKSNLKLQQYIKKYGLESFNLIIYYFHKDSNISLTKIETSIISAFPSSSLFNIKKKKGNSILEYKHKTQEIENIKSRFVNKIDHIMYVKINNKNTKNLILIKKSIRSIGLYDENNNLIEKFSDKIELANKFSLHKTTIYRYIKSGKLFKGKFYIREIKNK